MPRTTALQLGCWLAAIRIAAPATLAPRPPVAPGADSPHGHASVAVMQAGGLPALAAPRCPGQTAPGHGCRIGRPESAGDDSLLHAIRDAEDARAASPRQLETLRAGLRARSPEVRRTAVRALGRLRRAALVPEIASALGDASAPARAAAATALLDASQPDGAPAARAALLARLATERDPGVVGALAEALGWTPQGDSSHVRATAEALVARSRTPAGGDAPAVVLHGVAHGLFGLARQPVARRAMPPAAVERLAQLVTYRREARGPREDVEIRELAALAIVSGEHASERALMSVLADPDWSVRAAAQRAVLLGTLTDSAAADRVGRRAMADSAWQVRTLALTAYARRSGTRHGCAPFLAAAAAPVPPVSTAAVDALAAPCEPGSPALALLDSLAGMPGTLPGEEPDLIGTAWHLPAHALVSLAAVDPERARRRIPRFAANPDSFVRDYAARAAAIARDTATLRRLADDPHPNVRTPAVAGLSALLGHAADDLYIAALRADDSQLLQTAAKALEKSPDPRTLPALLAALDRVSADRSETWREARVALLERIRELGDSASAVRLRPYLADFDTLVAARAADAIGAWTGTRPTPRPVPRPRVPVPTEHELAALARARLVLEMGYGWRVVIRLFPYDAPTNAARVAFLARAGAYNGLTFHRAVLGRFVQGGSPAANEYSGWGRYSRDEFARPHRRGAVSMSTRGYDTADGQIVLHIADNFEYDHRYTVIGEIVSGLDDVERMQEGARILRATVRP
ncbi:MAG TPA: peptidylprolyl isomerase [Longimicrobiales bacterium]|nr:peptidylprolyl isomerase [Longimicrobiales bacterium]